MTSSNSAPETRAGHEHEDPVYDDLGAPGPDGADLEVEPPDDDSRFERLAEEFDLLREGDDPSDLF